MVLQNCNHHLFEAVVDGSDGDSCPFSQILHCGGISIVAYAIEKNCKFNRDRELWVVRIVVENCMWLDTFNKLVENGRGYTKFSAKSIRGMHPPFWKQVQLWGMAKFWSHIKNMANLYFIVQSTNSIYKLHKGLTGHLWSI